MKPLKHAAPDAGPTPLDTCLEELARQPLMNLSLSEWSGFVNVVRGHLEAQIIYRRRAEAADQELEEWKRNAEEYSQEAKDELDRRLAAEQEAERLRGEVAAAVALLEAVVAYVTAPGEFAEAPFDEKPITAFLAELKGQKL